MLAETKSSSQHSRDPETRRAKTLPQRCSTFNIQTLRKIKFCDRDACSHVLRDADLDARRRYPLQNLLHIHIIFPGNREADSPRTKILTGDHPRLPLLAPPRPRLPSTLVMHRDLE
ncbi:hypothetical protein A0H81_14032 [Grifola frondosa]|uniref:Uncharacterized protein n=1 Tax=Grifola frondosa TaxID=5627 RepID=A0A1C7LMM8_GRIFR|nr:hypothetical protein A0H81_14032 [Grifola frondosa]